MRRGAHLDATLKEVEEHLEQETKSFVSNVIDNQLQMFAKLKSLLPADCQRAKDIQSYIDYVASIKNETDEKKQEEMYNEIDSKVWYTVEATLMIKID